VANLLKPTAAKIADVFGRMEVLVASVILYVVGEYTDARRFKHLSLTSSRFGDRGVR
jgi:hypothetical protein